jgi:alkanesulfonate monooxygenase SsuD/methylene tetrahydromethanopterin reductase-like flavin-dependent oxidoreductase (luciferase family)
MLHLTAFLGPYGHHVAAWRHPDTDLKSSLFDLYRHQAQVAERACLDAVFFADNVALTGTPTLEPLTLLSALAASTTHLGLIGTVTTTYNEPYQVARKVASLACRALCPGARVPRCRRWFMAHDRAGCLRRRQGGRRAARPQ